MSNARMTSAALICQRRPIYGTADKSQAEDCSDEDCQSTFHSLQMQRKYLFIHPYRSQDLSPLGITAYLSVSLDLYPSTKTVMILEVNNITRKKSKLAALQANPIFCRKSFNCCLHHLIATLLNSPSWHVFVSAFYSPLTTFKPAESHTGGLARRNHKATISSSAYVHYSFETYSQPPVISSYTHSISLSIDFSDFKVTEKKRKIYLNGPNINF